MVSLGRFDTSARAADALIRLVGSAPAPARVLDLGSGGGALALAARRAWPDAEIVTVDKDPDVVAPDGTGFRHAIADVLRDDLTVLGRFDAVLCNPPFLPMPDGACVRGGLPDGLKGRAAGQEAVFALAALRLAAPGGRIGLILPRAVASSQAYLPLRRLVVENGLSDVLTLPRGAFRGADPDACLLGLRTDLTPRRIRIHRPGDGALWLSAEAAVLRCDGIAPKVAAGPSLAEIGAELIRGTLCPGRSAGEIRVHTTDLPADATEIVLPDAPREGAALAVPGDILIARVGRNLHRKVALVREGTAPFTDCVFRLRMPEGWRQAAMAMLVADGGAAVEAIARGTGARHLVREDVLNLRVDPVRTARRS